MLDVLFCTTHWTQTHFFNVQKSHEKRKETKGSTSGEEVNEFDDQQNQNLGISITDLPSPISVDILARLSVKRIMICKRVCKTWRDLISSPDFDKFHFARGEAFPLVRSLDPSRVSRTLYLVEPPEHCSGYDTMCGRPLKMKLDTKLKIPLHNKELVIKSVGDANMNPRSKGGIKLRAQDHELNVVHSCNGFLLLSEPFKYGAVVGETNPVMYEVIRTCGHLARKGTYSGSVTEIHILGTGSWKRIGNAPSTLLHKVGSPTYLNGSLHWLCREDIISTCIMSFDLNNEKFQSLSPPPFTPSTSSPPWNLGVTLGELRGCLCIYDGSGFEQPKVWVMKEYGVQGSWSKEFCLSTQTVGGRCVYGLFFEPISLLRNGAILLFHSLRGALFYRDAKKPGFRFLKFKGYKSFYESIAHIPSFISLKDAVMADDIAVLNTKSRGADFKLPGESKDLFLVEEDPVWEKIRHQMRNVRKK
ncbi:hypothetical protein RHSIM_Rhsim07G0063800 [Rhododendron simsii]|uniref:F-box domain-containing protein n=1 Tax=Rhododendron simsii TaxID=118357 RepID=A0A834GL68_RHOSS|nr:hypothetical protein RHSIM_Rhsim07G0063800 [Rhododendron simsii]